MIPNYAVVTENKRYNRSELGETHTPSLFANLRLAAVGSKKTEK